MPSKVCCTRLAGSIPGLQPFPLGATDSPQQRLLFRSRWFVLESLVDGLNQGSSLILLDKLGDRRGDKLAARNVQLVRKRLCPLKQGLWKRDGGLHLWHRSHPS